MSDLETKTVSRSQAVIPRPDRGIRPKSGGCSDSLIKSKDDGFTIT